MTETRIGFIGAGKMATALAGGMSARAGKLSFCAFDPGEGALNAFCEATAATAASSNADVVAASDVVFLAVKPQVFDSIRTEVASGLASRHLVVSIITGVSIARMQDAFGSGTRIVRVMPNTPALIGAGASAISAGGNVTSEDLALIESLLESVGIVERVSESLMNAVTGLSGSGPAYLYQIIEAMSDAGVRNGLPRDVATRLAAATVAGAGRMVLETGEHPGELKDAVTSPGGTTIAGISVMEAHAVRGAMIEAVCAAVERAEELG